MPKPASAYVRLPSVALACLLLFELVLPSPAAGGGPPPGPPTPETTPASGIDELGYDPNWVTPADPAPITVDPAGGADGAGLVADNGVQPRPDAVHADLPTTRTELADRRTEFSRTFANPDGTFDQELSGGRLNFRDPDGNWHPIDLSLVSDLSAGFSLRVAANDRTVRFSPENADSRLAQISAEGHSVTLRALGYGSGDREGNVLTFEGTGSRGAVGVQPSDYGFEFHVTLDGPDQGTVYHFAFDIGDLAAVLGRDGQTVQLIAPPATGFFAGDEPGDAGLVGLISAPLLLQGGSEEGTSDVVSVNLALPGSIDLPSWVRPSTLDRLGVGEVLLSYRISPDWLAEPARTFPVVLDPSVCIGGQSGCTASPPSFDEFIFSNNPNAHADGWTVVRTGYDNRTECCPSGLYDAMRGLFYFPDVVLGSGQDAGDGKVVTAATLDLTIDVNYGNAVGKPLQVYRVNRAWATNLVDWGDMTVPTNGWDASPVSPTVNVPGGTNPPMQFNVTDLVRSWYTRRGADWRPNIGFMVRYVTESAATGETTFRKQSAIAAHRPKLTITWEEPKHDINFDPALGSTYAPSTMVAGQTTKLPVVVTNNAAINYDTTNWKFGFRWVDAQGAVVSSAVQSLTSAINAGTTSGVIPLVVTPPTSIGQYTLRLDMVRVVSGTNLWASDWAKPSLYYSRNKSVLTSDSTRWTGSSVIERDEFGINVVTAGGASGELRWVTLGDDARVGINLGTRNLRLEGSTGLGFRDLVDLDLTYGYDRANVSDCSGILDACGWYTNWDERFTILTGGYTYQAPSGDRYLVATDPQGQLHSGAPVRLERSGVTLWDESNLNWTVGTPPVVSTAYAYSGTHSLSISAGDVPTEASFIGIDPRHYSRVSVWAKSSGTNKAAIGFRIADYGNGGTAYWFFYTFGSTSWSVPGFTSLFINSGTALTSGGGYYLSERNLFTDARTAIPSLSKNLRIENIDLRGSAGGTGSLYYDAVAFDGDASTAFDDVHPSWTSYSQSGTSTDRVAGSNSLKITSAPLATSPDCVGCNSTDLTQHSFATWWWKKVGGASIAFVFHLKDTRSNGVGDITYYAGSVVPDGATNPVQVSPTLPTTWTPVTRNLLEDARQILGFYNDNPAGTDPSAPPSAPVPDDVTMTGFRLSAVDGTFALFDAAAVHTLTRTDGTAVAEDDFSATYPDRSIHFFNHNGLLERIVDRDGNTVSLDWTFNYNPGSYGPSAYTLTTIRAAGDGMGLSGGTAQREIAVTTSTPTGFKQWTFTEQLGSTSSSTGRRADFYVATTTGTTYGNGDLVKVSPARHNTSTCPSTRPSGCTEYDYTTSTSHALDEIRDPRWDGSTSGSTDYRYEITYPGADPVAIADRSHNSAALLYVASFDTGTSTTYQRALVQDAAQRAAQMATYVDLLPGGSAAVTYVPKPCTTGQCTTSSGTFPTAPASTDSAATNQFDGLARVSVQTLYRVTGASPQLVVTRRATNAGAKVDNYADALAGGEVVWSQSADQYLASLRDSTGSNPDLYRTEYAYDGYHQRITTSEPHYNRLASYPSVVSLSQTALPTAYWRLNETSGTTAADTSGNGYTGTLSATGVTLNQPGALIGDSAPAMLFNGSTGRITSTVALPQTAYTMSAWVREQYDYSAVADGKGIIGRWNNNGALLYLAAGKLILVHNASYLQPGVRLLPNRWYHVAATWDGTLARVYIDGRPVGVKPITGAPGAGGTNFEIGSYANGYGTTFNNALIDEVALYSKALTSVQIEGQYVAGRSMARDATHTLYDGEGHPTERVHHFIVNGGFENGLTEYEGDSNPVVYFGAAGDPNIKSGFASLQITGWAYVRQDAQFVPGQTVRWQFAVKTDGGASSKGTYDIKYWRLSTNSWVDLVYTSHLTSTWTTKAYDLTIPWDSDGRMRISFWNNAYTGTAYFDDMVLVTDWNRTEVSPTGQVADTYLLQPGSSSGATLRTNVARTSTSAYPAIFPTTVTVNYIDGVYSDTARDKDLITARTFDVWGRPLTTTDPDGVVQTTAYAGNQTDVASVSDSLVTTTFTSDAVGNRLTSSTASEVTTTTYDLRNHALTVSAPDGVVSLNTYSDYGLRTASYANYLDGTPSGAGGTDDLKTTYAYNEYGRLITTVSDTGYSGSPDATTAQTYDRLGTIVSTTAYAGPGTGGPRTTTQHFETYTGGSIVTRASPSGVQLPIAPTSSPARLCPGSASVYCNSVATWLRNGTWVSAVDLTGRAFATTDAYGKVTVNDVDFAGHSVQTIASYVAGGSSTADQNVTASAKFDIAGRQTSATDAMGRVTATIYDDVDRPTQVTQQDPILDDIRTKAVYAAAGRVDRVAAPDTTYASDATRNWTRTEYDIAGRAVRTLEHYDINGYAHYRIDGFETGSDGWAATSTGWFTTAGAGSSGLDSEFHAVAPLNGNGRLRVTTSAGSANSGVWWDVSGQTYQSGHTYHLHADVRGTAGSSVEALFGVDVSGTNYATTGSVSTTGTWQTIDLNWTPTTTVSANVHVALRKPSAGAVDVFLDNVQIYETADPAWNIPTETAYDPTGRITASLLPPGHIAEAPLVTTTAYDLASRPVSVTVNAARAYSHQVIADGATNGLVAYFPLDERSGTTATDAKSALNATYAGTRRLAVAGGVDENRTAVAFDGSTGAATRTANVTAVTNNFSLETWFRRDAAGTNQVIVHNGTATTGWGLGLDGSGNLAARYETTGWLSTSVSPTVGVWHHAVVVRNAGTTTVYLDGTAYTPSSATAAPSTPGAGFSIGRQAASTRYFAGAVDEAAVYTSALSAAAVGIHWASGRPSAADVRLTTRTGYDALSRATEEISPRGILSRSTFDRLGRTTATTANYRDGSPAGATTDDDVTSTAAYNALGELLGTCSGAQVFVGGCDPSSGLEDQAWRYGYDAMGHQVSQVPPVNQSATALSSRSWTYDPGGRLTSTCDFTAGGSCATASRHTDFTYDALGRELTRTVYQGSGAGTPKLTWTNTWNADGTQATVAFDGTASSEGTDTLTFTYDGLGRPAQVKRSTTVLTDYGWNADNTLATRVDGTLGTTNFTYDWADRMASMTSPVWTGSLTWTYRLDGLLDTRQWPAGASGQATLTYDAAKRATAFAKVGGSAASFTQTYDRGGNVVSEGRSLTGVSGDAGTNTQALAYDALNRVTAASGLATSLAYTHDRDSNRLTRTAGAATTAYAYDRTGVLLSRYDNPTTTYYQYDIYGNMTSNASAVNQNTTSTYDLADRLLTVVLPGGGNNTTSFTLDALGRIATRTPPGAPAETYSYLGTSEAGWQISATSTTSSALDPGGNRVATASGGTTGYTLPDLHANLAAVTNSAETAHLSATRYDPYGLTAAIYDSGGAFPTPWKFQGQLDISADPADPLYEFSARFYLPATGSFSQLDTYAGSVADPQSLNRYLYAGANPWTLIDPTGHYAMEGLEPGPNDVVVAANTTLVVSHGTPSPCSGAKTNCSVWDIEFMSLEDKIQLTYAWERLSGAQDWFSAIRGILKVGGERELVHPRSWFSRVDAHILYGIQEGIALLMNRRTKPGIASGYDWKVFFESEAAEVLSDDALIALWGKAELHSTNIGREVAESHGLTPSADEKSVLSDLGDVYRIGLHYRSVARDLAVFPPGAGYMLGEILDPRSEEWSYALASGAYWLAADASWPQPTLPLPLWFWMLQ